MQTGAIVDLEIAASYPDLHERHLLRHAGKGAKAVP
jgi:hypothetical protein